MFALIDYIQYRFMLGEQYSQKALERRGYKLCTRENLRKAAKELGEIGFIYFHMRVSFLSWIIMYFSGPTSHEVTYIGNYNIIDCTTDLGVIKTSLAHYEDNSSYFNCISFSGLVDENNLRLGKLFLESQIGAKFNWIGVFIMGLSIIFGAIKGNRKVFYDVLLLLGVLIFVTNSWFISSITAFYVVIYVFNSVRSSRREILQKEELIHSLKSKKSK